MTENQEKQVDALLLALRYGIAAYDANYSDTPEYKLMVELQTKLKTGNYYLVSE